jgi:hypothetical protein
MGKRRAELVALGELERADARRDLVGAAAIWLSGLSAPDSASRLILPTSDDAFLHEQYRLLWDGDYLECVQKFIVGLAPSQTAIACEILAKSARTLHETEIVTTDIGDRVKLYSVRTPIP